MSKFVKVMTAKVEGFDTVRRFGIDILVQIITMAIFYAVFNSFKDLDSDKLGASHFAISVVIMALITIFQIYKRKLALMESQGQKIG